MAAAQLTPNFRVSPATESSSAPTRRQIWARARSVSTARGAINSERSDQLLFSQSGSGQRQIRFAQANTTGRPDTVTGRAASVSGDSDSIADLTGSGAFAGATHRLNGWPTGRRARKTAECGSGVSGDRANPSRQVSG